jgi:hypothetical protein
MAADAPSALVNQPVVRAGAMKKVTFSDFFEIV